MSVKKREIRNNFRKEVFERDKYACVTCLTYKDEVVAALDAHHITDRNLISHGGYVLSNGISLCADCHVLAEEEVNRGRAPWGWRPFDLYALIGSSYGQACTDAAKSGK